MSSSYYPKKNILPSAYLPPAAYIAFTKEIGEFQVEIHETYQKQSYRNHCCIYGPNGEQVLSIPVNKVTGNHTKTKDIRISYTLNWQKTHWRSIETAYRNSPFFLYYEEYFIPFFEKKYDFLVEFNGGLQQAVFSALKIPAKFNYTNFFEKSESLAYELLVSKKFKPQLPSYQQVFSTKSGFISNLSILDAIFNLGPETSSYLNSIYNLIAEKNLSLH